MKRRYWIGLTVLAAAIVVVSTLLLRRVPFFEVREVEIRGARYLSQEQILAGLDLDTSTSVFASLGKLEENLEALPSVRSAEISRELPARLRVVVREEPPVALASGPDGMIPLSATARPLPYDPTRAELDLPLVERPDPALVAVVSRLRTGDRQLFQDLQWVRWTGSEIVLVMRDARQVLVGSDISVQEIKALGAVVRHLAAQDREFSQVDARFDGWVVVRREAA